MHCLLSVYMYSWDVPDNIIECEELKMMQALESSRLLQFIDSLGKV